MQSFVLAAAWVARALAGVWVDLRRGSAVVVVLAVLSVDLSAAYVGADTAD